MSDQTQSIYSTLGGMNQAVDPMILRSDQYAMGVNISSRSGIPVTRPRLVDAGYTIPSGGNWQGAAVYRLSDADRIIFGIDGHVYSLNLSTGVVTDHGVLLSTTASKFYFCQANKYFIVQDGEAGSVWTDANWPVILTGDAIYDQSALRLSDPEQAVPKGSAMAYGHGRLFVVTNYIYESNAWSTNLGAIGFVAGDIIKSYRPADLLLFTENIYWAEGGRMEPAAELGTLHALAIQKNIISGVGSGPLLTFGEHGVSSFEVNTPRDQWKDIEIAKVMYLGSGSYSPLSFIHVNADLLFRSTHTEVRSLREATSQMSGEGLLNWPLSGEVRDILARDNIEGLKLASAAYHNKRALFTTGYQGDGTFNSLACLDLSPIEIHTSEIQQIWDGVWTGADWLGVVTARTTTDQLYAFCKTTGGISLFRLTEDSVVDATDSEPVCRLYTGYKHYVTDEDNTVNFSMKQLKYVELWFSDILGDLDVVVYFRPDSYPLWAKTNTATIKVPSTGFGQNRNHLRLVPDKDASDPVTGDALFAGYAYQFCIQWTGKAKLDKSRFVSFVKDEMNEHTVLEETTPTAIVETSSLIDLDDYEYRFTT